MLHIVSGSSANTLHSCRYSFGLNIHLQQRGSHSWQPPPLTPPEIATRQILWLQNPSPPQQASLPPKKTYPKQVMFANASGLASTFELRIQTDGTLTPRAALQQTCRELVNDLSILSREFTKEWELRKMVGDGARGDEKDGKSKGSGR